jgi:transcriptional regulator with PAS, ATPase and Fis domain
MRVEVLGLIVLSILEGFYMFQQLAEEQSEKSVTRCLTSMDTHPVFESIVTNNPEMEKIFTIVEKVAKTQSTILILGESGTGKELIARAIHKLSGHKGHFVPVNCGAIPDNLLESELFGYEKGAFTGATNSKPGRFVLANGGTIFLDEIGEMSPHLQVKLLRVLQDKVVEPVGGVKSNPINVRIIAATHVNLQEKVSQGLFREDLYYRLQVVPIEIPSLRTRVEDIALLANHFSQKYSKDIGRKPLLFSQEVLDIFAKYPWPGNIREIENLIERLSILVDDNAVYTSDLPPHIKETRIRLSGCMSDPKLPVGGIDFNEAVDEFENSLIIQALTMTNGNKKAAANLLNLNRTTLVEKIKKKGIEGAGNSTVL